MNKFSLRTTPVPPHYSYFFRLPTQIYRRIRIKSIVFLGIFVTLITIKIEKIAVSGFHLNFNLVMLGARIEALEHLPGLGGTTATS
jgi:hypothetical protein